MAPTRSLAERLHDALPQTQCTRCGYADCRGYAEAVAAGLAEINRCPPGGAEGIGRIAAIAARQALPLDPECGIEAPRGLARIDETACIGCALCLKACPVDAIVGAGKRMHTVIDPLCTGCELCLPVCPVDCISMVETSHGATGWSAWSEGQADLARRRYAIHRRRVAADAEPATSATASPASTTAAGRAAAAVAKARARNAGA